jgi:hypothetical protein
MTARIHAATPAADLKPDKAEIRRALDALTTDGQTFEIRAIDVKAGDKLAARSRVCHTVAAGVAAAVESWTAKGTYFTLNPLKPDLNKTAKDADVLERHWLLVDVDAVRGVTGVQNATEAEKQAAIELGHAIRDSLTDLGWPRPIVIDSGNGGHLLYWIELPNDDASRDLVKAVLTELARRFDTNAAKVDTSVFNAARISKLPGTVVRKGPHSPERPYRVARLIELPEGGEIVTRERLEALRPKPEPPTEKPARHATGNGKPLRSGTASTPTMTKAEYGQDELQKEVTRWGGMAHPDRHKDLLRATMSLAGLVKAGCLTEHDAIGGLHSAAASNGFKEEDRLGEIDEAWRSAMLKAAARALPRHVVDPSRDFMRPASLNGHGAGTGLPKMPSRSGERPRVSNCRVVTVEGKPDATRHEPRYAEEIADELITITTGWPKRLEEILFVQSADFRPIFLDSSTQLFAYIDSLAAVYWPGGASLITQERFHEYFRKFKAERFKAIERFPHFPTMPETFYMHPKVKITTGRKYFRKFMDFFEFAGGIDRSLGEAAVLTLFWGGTPGARPCFLLRGPVEDEPSRMGRSVGKSAFVEINGNLVGGVIDLHEGEDIPALKTRLLSDDGADKRVLRIDNVKTVRMGWAELESLITSDVISGKRLFRGEGSRPNTVTTFITMNGGSLSKDMATRSIEIRLKRPCQNATWRMKVDQFIDEHRWDVIAEIGGILADRQDCPDMGIEPRGRWAEWQGGVLGKVEDYAGCQDEIDRRCQELDSDDEEAFVFEEVIREKLRERHHQPEKEFIAIPTNVMGTWYSGVQKDHISANTATARIKLMPLKRLRWRRATASRFWLWSGEEATGSADKPSPLNGQALDAPLDKWGS